MLKYTFGNGVNLVSVQQESLLDCYSYLYTVESACSTYSTLTLCVLVTCWMPDQDNNLWQEHTQGRQWEI